jgi:hypothetical protein
MACSVSQIQTDGQLGDGFEAHRQRQIQFDAIACFPLAPNGRETPRDHGPWRALSVYENRRPFRPRWNPEGSKAFVTGVQCYPPWVPFNSIRLGEDLHPLAVEHARHTKRKRPGIRLASSSVNFGSAF